MSGSPTLAKAKKIHDYHSQELVNIWTTMGWGNPFAYHRWYELDLSLKLGLKVAQGWKGGPDIGEDGEVKVTTQDKIQGTYTGISVQETLEEQRAYIFNEKIGPYAHYIAKYAGVKVVECWKVAGKTVAAQLWPKIEKQWLNSKDRKDPKIGPVLTQTQIYKHGVPVDIPEPSVMKSEKLMYSDGKNDECYTPAYAVTPILKYIPKCAIVWCPFDKPESEFVKQISKTNKVVHSHIDDGQDFFNYEPENWDVIISNPPFTNKRKFFERALGFNKPFALIMSNTWLNDAAPVQLFMDKGLQLLMFDKRMKFIMANGQDNAKITFSSSYFCWNFLPQQIVMEHLVTEEAENLKKFL